MKLSNIMLVLCVIGLLISGVVAASNGKSANQVGVVPVITLEALKGQAVTDLLIHVPSDITETKKIQVKAYDAAGSPRFSRNVVNITPVNGIVSLQFDDLQRGDHVTVRLQTEQYGWLDNSTTVLNRPDLIIASAATAGKVVSGDTLVVNVSVQEKNGDLGAEAVVSLLDGETVLDTRDVSVSAGGTASTLLSTALTSRGEHNLSIRITSSVPAEYDETNNIYNLVVGVVSPDLTVSGVSAPSQVTAGERFDALATITELSGEAGATATIALLENGTVMLDSKPLSVPAGGSGTVTLSTLFPSRGDRSLSIRIMNSVPAEYDVTNNVYALAVKVVSPDLAVTNVSAPSSAAIGQTFEVHAEISELYGDIGATATIALLGNGTVQDSKTVYIPAGNSSIASLNGSLTAAGIHTMTVRIIDSVPADAFPGNNEQSFPVEVNKSPETMSIAGSYYYQNTSFNNSRHVTGSGYEENGVELVLREDEVISLTAASKKSLSFPARLIVSITTETGGVTVYEETGVVPALVEGGRKVFTKYYDDNNTVLTLSVGETGTTLSIEGRANNSIKYSSGFTKWWFKPAQEWNVAANASNGNLIRATAALRVNVEVEDGTSLLGGTAAISVGNVSYAGGWVDTTDGRIEEQRSVRIYSGNISGDAAT